MTMRKKSYPYSDKGAFPILAENTYGGDDIAFEKMSDELLAYKSDHGSGPGNRAKDKGTSRKNKLKNPSGSCRSPHQVGGVGSGDGTCYQKHNEYGSAGAGTNGSTERAEYMRNYRKTKDNPDGVWTPEAGPETGKATRGTVPKPFGDSKKRASIRVAFLRKQLEEERSKLFRLADENPLCRGEVYGLLTKQAFRGPYKKNVKSQTFNSGKATGKSYKKQKPLYNPRGGKCLMGFREMSNDDWKAYAKEFKKKNKVDGGCYQVHNEYGKAPKDYQKWYNENVRKYKKKDPSKPYSGEYQGPESGKGSRSDRKNFKENIARGWTNKFYEGLNSIDRDENREKKKTETKSEQVQNVNKGYKTDSDAPEGRGGGRGGRGRSTTNKTTPKKTETKKTETKKTKTKKTETKKTETKTTPKTTPKTTDTSQVMNTSFLKSKKKRGK